MLYSQNRLRDKRKQGVMCLYKWKAEYGLKEITKKLFSATKDMILGRVMIANVLKAHGSF